VIVPVDRFRTGETSYSDMVTVSGPGIWVHIAGQLAFDEDRRIVGSDVTTQAHRCLDRIEALLQTAGGQLNDIVGITVYLTELEHYPEFDRVRAERFPQHAPASAAVKVAGLLFQGLIEISAIAFVPMAEAEG
jgi:enamine deaminase RidA (YjgF/YER057c/UK114 family)